MGGGAEPPRVPLLETQVKDCLGKRPGGPKARQTSCGHSTVPTSLRGAAPVYRAQLLPLRGRGRRQKRQTPTRLAREGKPRELTGPTPPPGHQPDARLLLPPAQRPHLLNREPSDCACALRLESEEGRVRRRRTCACANVCGVVFEERARVLFRCSCAAASVSGQREARPTGGGVLLAVR